MSGTDFAMIQKVFNTHCEQWIFYVAGSIRSGTTASYLYLVNNWARLHRDHGAHKPFLVVLRISDGNPNRYEVVYSRCSERPQSG